MTSIADDMRRVAAERSRARVCAPPLSKPLSVAEQMIAATGITPRKNSDARRALLERGVPNSYELERVLHLPRRTLRAEDVPDMTDRFAVRGCAGCRLCPGRLRPLQSAALAEAQIADGLLALMSVGSGKSLVTLLVAEAMGARRPLLLVPASVKHQLLAVDVPLYARHFRISVPRERILSYDDVSRTPLIDHEEWEKLSPADRLARDLLFQLDPDLLILDEAHKLRNKSTSRGKRFGRFFREHPECRVVALSGTMTRRSLHDYEHLAQKALGSRSPLPQNYRDLSNWAQALDADVELPVAPGELLRFADPDDWEGLDRGDVDDQQTAARRGFRRRLVETQGVVASQEQFLGSSLVIRSWAAPAVPEIDRALRELRRSWRVGDEEIDEAARFFSYARQIAAGFYYLWDWSFRDPLGPDAEWIEARSAWHRAVRQYLKSGSRPGLDSPFLVAAAVQRGEIPHLAPLWEPWAAVRDRPEPPTVPVWISGEVVAQGLEWIREPADEGRGVLWYEHRAVGDALRALGARVFGAGEDAELISFAESGDGSCACSMAHAVGKNLQYAFSRNLVLSPPAGGATWEQLLGRTHREGQVADEVVVDVAANTPELERALAQARRDARYEETTNGPQKLLYASWSGFGDLDGGWR